MPYLLYECLIGFGNACVAKPILEIHRQFEGSGVLLAVLRIDEAGLDDDRRAC